MIVSVVSNLPQIKEINSWDPVCEAVKRRDVESVRQLVTKDPTLVKAVIANRGSTLLHHVFEEATSSEQQLQKEYEIVELLLNAGADVNAPNANPNTYPSNKMTPLSWFALRRGYSGHFYSESVLKIAKLFLLHKAVPQQGVGSFYVGKDVIDCATQQIAAAFKERFPVIDGALQQSSTPFPKDLSHLIAQYAESVSD